MVGAPKRREVRITRPSGPVISYEFIQIDGFSDNGIVSPNSSRAESWHRRKQNDAAYATPARLAG
jgi:hypothetical protein